MHGENGVACDAHLPFQTSVGCKAPIAVENSNCINKLWMFFRHRCARCQDVVMLTDWDSQWKQGLRAHGYVGFGVA